MSADEQSVTSIHGNRDFCSRVNTDSDTNGRNYCPQETLICRDPACFLYNDLDVCVTLCALCTVISLYVCNPLCFVFSDL